MKRFAFSGLVALGTLAASVQAQTAGAPQLVPPLPAPPLPVPLSPAPLDSPTPAIPDASRKGVFAIQLRGVRPSTMAFWLDPKNHAAPLELQNQAITKRPNFKEGDALDIPSPLPGDWKLPAGVDRIVAVDPQNVLLVFGTAKGVDELKATIAVLDKPARKLEAELTLFWIDALAPDAARLGASTSTTTVRAATSDDLATLESLVRDDRAMLVTSPPLSIVPAQSFTFSLPPTYSSPTPTIPNVGKNQKFDSPMPVWKGDPQIDPDIQAMHKPSLSPLPQITPPSPLFGSASDNFFRLGNPDVRSKDILLSLSVGQTWLISGDVLGLKPPSPRFGFGVLIITPRVVSSRNNSSAAPKEAQP